MSMLGGKGVKNEQMSKRLQLEISLEKSFPITSGN
jgi:hypothetical protein